jgi:fermentation-respiration switch protein FrsA (DUF1100 family)
LSPLARRSAITVLLAVLLAVGAVLGVGSILVAPSRRKVLPPPTHLHGESVTLTSLSGERLAGWVFIPTSPRAAVVVLHGVRANRSDMLGRAELLWNDGFVMLALDLQAHGESTGAQITYGYRESQDVEAAVRYLRLRFPALPVGGIGVSLGGAALALAGSRVNVDAAVLEAVYPSIEEAVDNRIRSRVGPLADVLSPLLLVQLEPRLGVRIDDLRPVAAVQSMRCPILIISGTKDVHTTVAQTQALFAAANEPKELWLVPGAAHVDLLRYDPRGYEEHVLGFLERHLADTERVGRRK